MPGVGGSQQLGDVGQSGILYEARISVLQASNLVARPRMSRWRSSHWAGARPGGTVEDQVGVLIDQQFAKVRAMRFARETDSVTAQAQITSGSECARRVI
jgi:hypothetical protein